MNERDEYVLLFQYWADKKHESTGFVYEHAEIWERYYRRKLGLIALKGGK